MEGIERIKALASEIKDPALLKVVEYLLSREDMNDKYLNESKSLKSMVDFIKGQAKKQAKNGMAMIENEVVYGWAIHYWDENNKDLDIKEEPEEAEEVKEVKPIKKVQKKEWVAEGQLSLF